MSALNAQLCNHTQTFWHQAPARVPTRRGCSRVATRCMSSTQESAQKYDWKLDAKPNPHKRGDLMNLPITAIRRPLGRTRSNDQDKVQALMDSIEEVGLKEPIDILEVDGRYYGFSGCHRYEAFQRLGLENIPCKVRKANQSSLRMHMM